MSKNEVNIPADKLKLYEKLIKAHPDIESKGKNNPYTSINGHMFSFLRKDGILGLRLAKNDREEFMEKHQTGLIESYGAVMKEYVEVPDDLFKNIELMKTYLQKSYDYACSLKPKPTKKKI